MPRSPKLFALVAVALLGLLAVPASVRGGQDATPPPPEAVGPAEQLLFVQTFESGAWAAKAGEQDVFELTLTGGGDQTLYFANRPNRDVGTFPTQQLMSLLSFAPEDPPNAAVVAQTADGEDVLVVELLNPRMDAAGTLTYDAQLLAEYQGDALARLAAQQANQELPESFGPVSLFIDLCAYASGPMDG